MKIISSQHYINWEIVESKMEEIKDMDKVVIPCTYVGFIDGIEYAMQNDRHHTLAAARELGISVEFEISADEEGLEGERLLEYHYMDGDWYDIESSNPAYDQFAIEW